MTALSTTKTILIVDDSPVNINVIGNALSPHYSVRAANSGERVFQNIHKSPLPDLILLDVMMADMDGYTVLKKLREIPETLDIPVIFVTAMDHDADEQLGLDLGAVDYITKPVRPAILLARIRAHLELKEIRDHLKHQNKNLEGEVKRRIAESNLIRDISMKALSCLAKTRDNETGNHILRTQAYVELLARELASKPEYKQQLNDNNIERIVKAAPLHDIGKVGIPDSILLKPGKLSTEEFAVMKNHARLGADALRECIKDLESHDELDFLNAAIEISHYHHEKWDGSGYPEGLSGESIPLSARLMSLADVFDALISRRVYKPPFAFDKSVEIILNGNGNHFDPAIVKAFDTRKDEFLEISQRYSDDDYDFSSKNAQNSAVKTAP